MSVLCAPLLGPHARSTYFSSRGQADSASAHGFAPQWLACPFIGLGDLNSGRGLESGESFTDNQRHILIFNSDSSLILQGCKHYFALHVIYLSLLGSYSVSTRSLKVSLKVFGGQKPTLAWIQRREPRCCDDG